MGHFMLYYLASSMRTFITICLFHLCLFALAPAQYISDTVRFNAYRGDKPQLNYTLAMAISSDGSLLITGHLDSMLRSWNAYTGVAVDSHRLSRPAHHIAWSPKGNGIAATNDFSDTITIRNPAALKTITHLLVRKRPITSQTGVRGITYSTTGDTVLATYSDDSVALWSIAERKIIKTLHSGMSDPIRCLMMRDSKRCIVIGGNNGTINIIDIATGSIIRTGSTTICQAVWGVSLSEDESLIAVSCINGKVRVFDIATMQVIRAFNLTQNNNYRVAISPDNQRLAVSWIDTVTALRIYDIQKGDTVASFRTGYGFRDVQFTDNGQRLVLAGTDGVSLIWKIKEKTTAAPKAIESAAMLRLWCTPNLVSNQLHVFWEIPEGDNPMQLELQDYTGRIVQSAKVSTIADRVSLALIKVPSGVYLLTLRTASGAMGTHRIMVAQ